MSLTPPQYRQMKQYLESSSRIELGKGSSLPQETKDLILKYRVENKLGSQPIADILEKDHGIKLNQSTVGGVITQAKKDKVPGVDIPKKELASSVKQKIYSSPEERNIYKEVRVITANDRKINPNIPKNAKFKVQVPSGEKGTSTKMVYTTTESAAENAIKKADKFTITKKLEKKKPFDRAVKAIHAIAMKDPTDINNARQLAGLIYGNTSDDALRMVAQDLIRYQEFLLGFREVPGIISPQGLMLDEILSEFPPQNQWGKFASEELRRSRLNIRDQLLKTKGKKLSTLRTNILKAVDTNLFNLDEVVGIAATFENAPGYTELTQVIDKKINTRKGLIIDGPFSRLFPKVLDGTAGASDIDDFNKVSKAFQEKFKVDTPIIISEPGKKVDASKYIKNFDALSGPAKKNITDIATQKGIVIQTKGVPLTQELKPGTPLYKQLMKFCPNSKANGGTVGTCSIDEAVTGMKNEITKVRTGAATTGEASRLANKFKNFGSKGARALFKAGVVSELFLETALGFDKVISEGESTMQALRKSYLTAPFRGLGLMKSYEEGIREELIGAATDKDRVEYVLDQQELINDKNEAVKQLQRLKDQYEQETFGAGNFSYTPDNKEFIQKKIDEKQADIKDMYRSGKLSKAEQLITGFQKPMDLKIKDKAYYDALIDAQEKLSVINAPKFVPPGAPRTDQEGNLLPSIIEERRLKKRIEEGDMLTPEKINKYLENQNLPVDETVDILGGYDKILQDAGFSAIAEAGGVANLAGGGIAKQAGDPSGAMLENMNPDSQGLSGLFKRVMKIKE